jgi:hypothetical protein
VIQQLTCWLQAILPRPAIDWALIIGGWYLVHRMTLHRERRKEGREAVSGWVRELKELQKDALGFHRSKEFDSLRRRDLQARLHRLGGAAKRRPLDRLQVPDAKLVKLRQAISAHNFDPSDFQPQEDASELLDGICEAVDEVCDFAESARESRFP